jgi:thiamine phosphate synthase YjbQ (UPF0047 family)
MVNMIAEHRTLEVSTRGNGHSLVRATTVGPSLALPVVDGAVPLGIWQQIVFMDFDTRPRQRTVHLSVVGV